MSLQDQLTTMRGEAEKRIPAGVLSEMLSATEELRNSGIMGTTIKPGDKFPAFKLKNQHGIDVRSEDLLSNGNILLTIFRGHW